MELSDISIATNSQVYRSESEAGQVERTFSLIALPTTRCMANFRKWRKLK